MRFLGFGCLAFATLAAVSSSSSAVTDQQKQEKEARRLKTAPFNIVLVVMTDGSRSLAAIEPMNMKERQKELLQAYAVERRIWLESKALFRKSPENKGKKFTESAPVPPTLTTWYPRVRGQEKAQAILKELEEKKLKPMLKKEKDLAKAKAEKAGRSDPRERPEFRPKGNQVRNGGFEELRSDGDLADCWTSGQWGAPGKRGSTRRTKSNPHGGECSVVLRALSDGAKPGLYTNVKLPPGEYEVRYWACADAGATASVQASFGGRDLARHSINEEWRQFKETVTVDKRGFQAKLQIWTESYRVRVFVDDVEMEAVERAKPEK